MASCPRTPISTKSAAAATSTSSAPRREAMEALGDKNTARSMARKAKVPVVPGSDGLITDEDEAVKTAHEIGFPVLIKATAGGGGKGMRVAAQRSGAEDRAAASPHRGRSRVRQRRRLPGKVHRSPAARRSADHRRPSRQRLSSVRARLQHAAAASKADRGKPRPASAAGKAPGHVRSGRAADQGTSATPTPAPSSSSSIRTTTSISSRSTPASRSSTP